MKEAELHDILHFGYPLRDTATFWKLGNSSIQSIDLPKLKTIFLDSCEHLLNGASDVILPLSGGLDSRLILACLLEFLPPHRIHGFNYGNPGQLDFDIPPHIAKFTGIKFTQVSYDKISISPDDILAQNYNTQNTPAHNIIGFTVTQKASELALQQLGVDSDVPVWSGFLGDRIFFGKWSDNHAEQKEACEIFSDFYSINKNPKISLSLYEPAKRLQNIYATINKPEQLTWLEFLDLEQRQYRVRATLNTLKNPYCFLFEQPQVLQSIHSIEEADRKNGKLQREYFHQFYPQLCKLPVTSRFGYPLRKNRLVEKIDRYYRLSTQKLDNFFGSNMERFKRKKVTINTLKRQINGYESVLDTGFGQAVSILENYGLPPSNEQLNSIQKVRSRCELFSSIGYLCSPKNKNTQ